MYTHTNHFTLGNLSKWNQLMKDICTRMFTVAQLMTVKKCSYPRCLLCIHWIKKYVYLEYYSAIKIMKPHGLQQNGPAGNHCVWWNEPVPKCQISCVLSGMWQLIQHTHIQIVENHGCIQQASLLQNHRTPIIIFT